MPRREWQRIFTLARYGGLRTPSGLLTLKWDDNDWERNRFTIRSSKTEHHDAGGVRIVPIFPGCPSSVAKLGLREAWEWSSHSGPA